MNSETIKVPTTLKIGISLSGGSALGYAHLGILQAMEEAGFKPDCIVGTSMGAIMGVLYAAGHSPQHIRDLLKEEKVDHILHLAFPNIPQPGGLVNTGRIQKILLKYLPSNNFSMLKTKYYCCVSNMNTLEPEYHCEGDNLVQYVMASACMPVAFAPIKINNCYYVDGGIQDHLPIQPLLDEQCDIRIGSNVLVEKPGHKRVQLIWIHAFLCCSFFTYKHTADKFTNVIPVNTGKYWITDFKELDAIYNIGYRIGTEYFKTHDIVKNPS